MCRSWRAIPASSSYSPESGLLFMCISSSCSFKPPLPFNNLLLTPGPLAPIFFLVPVGRPDFFGFLSSSSSASGSSLCLREYTVPVETFFLWNAESSSCRNLPCFFSYSGEPGNGGFFSLSLLLVASSSSSSSSPLQVFQNSAASLALMPCSSALATKSALLILSAKA